MKYISGEGLLIFITIMIFILGLGGALIAAGSFDFWRKRSSWRRKKEKIDFH
jgi:hypothetical protein